LFAVEERLSLLEKYARAGGRVATACAPGIRPRLTDIGRKVVYVPLHAHGDHWHPDCEHGRISSFTVTPTGDGWFEDVNVKYDHRTACSGSQSTSSSDLVWFEDWRPGFTAAELLRAEIMRRIHVADDDGTSEVWQFGSHYVMFRGERFLNPEAALLANAYNIMRVAEPAPALEGES